MFNSNLKKISLCFKGNLTKISFFFNHSDIVQESLVSSLRAFGRTLIPK